MKIVWENIYDPVKPQSSPDIRFEAPTVTISLLVSRASPMSMLIAAVMKQVKELIYMPVDERTVKIHILSPISRHDANETTKTIPIHVPRQLPIRFQCTNLKSTS